MLPRRINYQENKREVIIPSLLTTHALPQATVTCMSAHVEGILQ